jgi:hypothetical protein
MRQLGLIELMPNGIDLEPRLITQMLNFVCGCCPRKLQMVGPPFGWIRQVRIKVSAVKNITRAARS